MINFFILAGGYGKRVAPLSNCLPKPMFPLFGKPLITRIISQLKKAGVSDGYVNLHHLGSKIKEMITDKNISFIYENSLSGSLVLSKISDESQDPVIVVNGDVFLEIPVSEMVKKLELSGAEGILLVKEKDINYSSLLCEGEMFKGVSASPDGGNFMFSGVSLFKRSFLRKIRDMNFFDTIERVKPDIRVVEYKGIWLDIGTPELYFSSDQKFRESLTKGYNNSISSEVYIANDAVVKNSILWRGCRIEGNSILENCIVSENVKIESGCYSKKIIMKDGIYDLRI